MNEFVYSYPTKVLFGEKAAAKHLPAELSKVGQTVMLAYGGGSIKRNGIYDELLSVLQAAGKRIVEFSGIMSNPTYAKVQEGAALAKAEGVDFILAVGGGSVLDCCKVVSAQAKLTTDLWSFEYGEKKQPAEFIPMGAVVTAFGTGSEMNNGAVITHAEKKIKGALWGAFYDFAILDPLYTMTMPLKQVFSGAFDSLSHCMETYMGKPRTSNLSDEINEACQRNIIAHVRATLANPQDVQARSELIWAAAMAENGILKIGKATDFQAHMLEHQLGAYTDCNHGQGLAVIHPVLYRHMLTEGEEQFARLAVNVWGVDPSGKSQAELAEAFVQSLAAFIKEATLPTTFAEMGISNDVDYKAIAQSTVLTPNCCKKFTTEELLDVLMECKG
ncbi:iron-containing alcohol dehydrogenase [Megasphaera hominis]|jgi:alcohol dehydrogenase YqhD (iron-dependent ADH family)|uniref:Iron-containing alcohol dehydrogenase n=1 Tax=Megasphaera hominis TaxID=159836 RepID=A0ABR6VHX9_9FIRM|nr:iron-containing alcohol dehydrogenase [Megasphaera hominis]MBC3536693.1 iron-containing alcohol dehydrogenase [Megasphaera hominis]